MCTRKWLIHALTLLSVTSAAVAVAAAPGNAEGVNRDTVGIDRANNSVTTRNGKILTGFTFVEAKDVATVRQQSAEAARQGFAVNAGSVVCTTQWHYISAGAANSYWKPQSGTEYVWANGNRSTDYWNQQFLPCWWSTWTEPNAWMFLANATGKFVDHYETHLNAGTLPNSPELWFALHAKIRVCHVDGYWVALYLYTSGANKLYAYRNPTTAAVIAANGPLSGNHLFYIDSPILTGTSGPCAN